MENALLVGLSRQMALSHELDIVANNVANIDTTGYKADNAAFSEYLMPRASAGQFSGADRRVSFVQDRASWIDFSPGALERTGDPLNVAIDGDGYLTVQTPRGQRYTRNGALALNATGQLVTSEGYQVVGDSGPITFQNTDHDIIISPTGLITVREGNSTADAQRGRLQLVSFDRPAASAKRRQQHVHAAERRHCRPGAADHAHRPRRGREIQRQRRRRHGAHDRNHPQL
jgi:flagellar basal-body rod protein FlgF